MPVWKSKRTGHTFTADAEYVAALGSDKYEQLAAESRAEQRERIRAEAREAKVELDDEVVDSIADQEQAPAPVNVQEKGTDPA